MPTEIHVPNIIGPVPLGAADDEGTLGQVLTSFGPGNQVGWASNTSPQPHMYLGTDKVSQAFLLAAGDLTWNPPAADAVSGVTYNPPGTFLLQPNRLYRLFATIVPTVALVAFSISWVDSGNVLIGSFNQPAGGIAGLAHSHAITWFRPLFPTIVKVRQTSAVSLTVGPASSVEITTLD